MDVDGGPSSGLASCTRGTCAEVGGEDKKAVIEVSCVGVRSRIRHLS